MHPKRTIFGRLFFSYLFIIFGSFILLSAILFFLFQNDLTQRYFEQLEQQKETIEHHITLAYQSGWDKELLTSTLMLGVERGFRSVYLYDHTGTLQYHVAPDNREISLDTDFVKMVLQGEELQQFVKHDRNKVFIIGAPIQIDPQYPNQAMFLVHHGFHNEAREMALLFIFSSMVTILLAAICLYLVSKRMTAPLRAMNDVALELAKGDFSQIVHVKREDEIGQLAKSFNHMAQELASLDQMRKEFVANVSHDLRSPLTSLNGFIGAILDGTIPPDKQKHYLTIMKEETERLIKLVNDLLDIARIEAGQVDIQRRGYNLSEQIRKILAKTEPYVTKQNIELKLEVDEAEDFYVYADPDRIEQVLINLIHNALQFSQPDSAIDICLRHTADQQVEISIKDYGKGIRADELKYIWDRFYKSDKARSNKVGTGIGLSIVKHIIDLHSTSISVESNFGEGTRITFKLPMPKEAPATPIE